MTPYQSAQQLSKAWKFLSKLPAGKRLFTRVIGFAVPYTSTLKGVCITRFEAGHVELTLPSKRVTRNHMGDAHALALANVAEMSSGLSLLLQIPEGVKATISGIRTEYLKRAQGTLRAVPIDVVFPDFEEKTQHEILSEIRNSKDEVVCKVYCTWSFKKS